MFGNLVNVHDASLLVEKARQGRLGEIARRIASRGASWDHVAYPLRNWWDIPEVMERWNAMISGDPNVDYCAYFLGKHVRDAGALTALSLGSGTGNREIELARSGRFRRIDAVDRSRARIAYSRERAAEAGFSGTIDYIEADAARVALPEGSYDLVIAEQFLHHVSPLEGMLGRIRAFLKPEGFFMFNEYVGPSRFQWTEAQLAAVNELLARLPARYRVRWKSGSVKRRVHRPGRLAMMLYDPTEAVESSRIVALIGKTFDVVETKGYGGTVLQLLFSDIAANFLGGDPETKRLLAMCFAAEDELLRSLASQSDFLVGICRKSRAGGARPVEEGAGEGSV
jgi:ubiquinone/menaquinone biosynthesis C-methylase UbiE